MAAGMATTTKIQSAATNPKMRPDSDLGPDRTRSIDEYRKLAAEYDAKCARIDKIRRMAINALALQQGQTVLDIACGTGITLPLLAAGVGPGGRVIGIEHSPEMAAIAQQRIDESRYANIDLIVKPAEYAHVHLPVDALLFSYAHDVQQSAAALKNIFSLTRQYAVVVMAGAKLINRWWSGPVDRWTRWRGQHYRSTQLGLERPWAPLLQYCPDMRLLQTFHLGTNYLARGTFSTPGDADSAPGLQRIGDDH